MRHEMERVSRRTFIGDFFSARGTEVFSPHDRTSISILRARSHRAQLIKKVRGWNILVAVVESSVTS